VAKSNAPRKIAEKKPKSSRGQKFLRGRNLGQCSKHEQAKETSYGEINQNMESNREQQPGLQI
jgi:hypothetical protein